MPSEKDSGENINNDFLEYGKTKDLDLRNKIVEDNLPLVNVLIKKFLNKGVDYDDLLQVGSMALVLAVERFDATKGFTFATFATPTIIGEIKRYFRDKIWDLKVPRKQKEIITGIPVAKEELRQKLGRNPTVTEIAGHMKFSVEEILEALESGSSYKALSLNQAMEESEYGDDSKLEKFTGVREKGYESIEDTDLVKRVMMTLSEREKDVFRGRFIRNMTQQQIAAELDVSQMTVSRMETEIRKKFRAEYYS